MLDQIVAVKKYIDTLSIVKTHTARIIKSSLKHPNFNAPKQKSKLVNLRFAQDEGEKSDLWQTFKVL